jgi:hypothetical protein
MSTVQRRILDAVRIAHRTPITRENSPSIRVVPIEDDNSGSGKGECIARRLRFSVQIIGRDDGGVEALDQALIDVLARLKPTRADPIPYPTGVRLKPPGRIRFDEELADEDVAVAEITFEATYDVAEWSLEA